MTSTIAELEASLDRAAHEAPGTPTHVDALAALAWELRARDPQRTVSLSREAESIACGLPFPRGLARSLLVASTSRFRLSELNEAKAAAEEALSLYSSVADHNGEAGAENVLGDYPRALEYSHRSLTPAEEIGDQARIGAAADSGRSGPGDVIGAADRALYEAKQGGRNRMAVSS